LKKAQAQPTQEEPKPQQPPAENPEVEKLRKELEELKKAQAQPTQQEQKQPAPEDPTKAELEKLRKELEEMKKVQAQPTQQKPEDPNKAEVEKLRKELEEMKKAQTAPAQEQKPAEPKKPIEQPNTPSGPTRPQQHKPTVDPALEKRLAALEVRVKQSNERLSTVAESMMKLANIGETVEQLSRNMASGNVPQSNDGTIRQELDEQLTQVRKTFENAQSSSLKTLQTRLDSLKDRVSTLSTALSNTQALMSQGGGNTLVVVFIIVQIGFAATMFYLNKHKNDVKKLF